MSSTANLHHHHPLVVASHASHDATSLTTSRIVSIASESESESEVVIARRSLVTRFMKSSLTPSIHHHRQCDSREKTVCVVAMSRVAMSTMMTADVSRGAVRRRRARRRVVPRSRRRSRGRRR